MDKVISSHDEENNDQIDDIYKHHTREATSQCTTASEECDKKECIYYHYYIYTESKASAAATTTLKEDKKLCVGVQTPRQSRNAMRRRRAQLRSDVIRRFYSRTQEYQHTPSQHTHSRKRSQKPPSFITPTFQEPLKTRLLGSQSNQIAPTFPIIDCLSAKQYVLATECTKVLLHRQVHSVCIVLTKGQNNQHKQKSSKEFIRTIAYIGYNSQHIPKSSM